MIVTAQFKDGTTKFASEVNVLVGNSYVAWYDFDGIQQEVWFEDTEFLGLISEAVIARGKKREKYDCTYLTWFVFNGQEVNDDFVIDGEVLSLEEVRKRKLKPRHI